MMTLLRGLWAALADVVLSQKLKLDGRSCHLHLKATPECKADTDRWNDGARPGAAPRTAYVYVLAALGGAYVADEYSDSEMPCHCGDGASKSCESQRLCKRINCPAGVLKQRHLLSTLNTITVPDTRRGILSIRCCCISVCHWWQMSWYVWWWCCCCQYPASP